MQLHSCSVFTHNLYSHSCLYSFLFCGKKEKKKDKRKLYWTTVNEDSFKQIEHDFFLSTLANLIFESNPQYSNQTFWHFDSFVICIFPFSHQLLYLWLAELREEFFNALCSIGTSCLLINNLGCVCKKSHPSVLTCFISSWKHSPLPVWIIITQWLWWVSFSLFLAFKAEAHV